MATTAVITTSALGALEEALAPTARNGPANTGCNSAQRRTASQLRCAACGYKGGKFRQDTLQTEDKTPFRYGTLHFRFVGFLGFIFGQQTRNGTPDITSVAVVFCNFRLLPEGSIDDWQSS